MEQRKLTGVRLEHRQTVTERKLAGVCLEPRTLTGVSGNTGRL